MTIQAIIFTLDDILDSDTIAAITGGIAEAYYGIPTEIRKQALTFLDERLLKILVEFENNYPSKVEK